MRDSCTCLGGTAPGRLVRVQTSRSPATAQVGRRIVAVVIVIIVAVAAARGMRLDILDVLRLRLHARGGRRAVSAVSILLLGILCRLLPCHVETRL